VLSLPSILTQGSNSQGTRAESGLECLLGVVWELRSFLWRTFAIVEWGICFILYHFPERNNQARDFFKFILQIETIKAWQ
jgi:hypothetical protein